MPGIYPRFIQKVWALVCQIHDYNNPDSSIASEDPEPLNHDLEDVLGKEIDLDDYQAVMRRRRASGAPAAQVETLVKLLNLLKCFKRLSQQKIIYVL